MTDMFVLQVGILRFRHDLRWSPTSPSCAIVVMVFKPMDLLIDGYNLLHETGIFIDQPGPRSLERLHAAYVEFLANALPSDMVERTTVVFDAKGRRATARRVIRHAGIKIVYAARDESADAVIAELVRQHHSPRNLTVVSSDHQV